MIPKVQVMNAKPREIGIVTGIDMDRLFQVSFDDAFTVDSKGKIINADSQKIFAEKLYEKIKKILRRTMFFDQPISKHGDRKRWNFVETEETENKKKLEEQEGNTNQPKLHGSGIVNFNIFGFVTNAFQYETNVKPIIESLCDFALMEKDLEVKRIVIRKFDAEFQKWRKYSGGFAIPLYNMDVTYNLMKRLRQRNEGQRSIEPEQYWDELIKIYIFVYEKLRENDEWYKALRGNSESQGDINQNISYAKAFADCPYIKWIFEENNKGTLQLKSKEIVGDNPEKDMSDVIEFFYKRNQVTEAGHYDEYTSYYD